MALISIVELGVLEAYEILTGHFGVEGLPPLDAIENEDWGRDYLLSRLFEMPVSELAEAGLVADAGDDRVPGVIPRESLGHSLSCEPATTRGGSPTGGGLSRGS